MQFQHWRKNTKRKARKSFYNWLIKSSNLHTFVPHTSIHLSIYLQKLWLMSVVQSSDQWLMFFFRNKQLSHTSVLIISVSVSVSNETWKIVLKRIRAVESRNKKKSLVYNSWDVANSEVWKLNDQLKLVQMF